MLCPPPLTLQYDEEDLAFLAKKKEVRVLCVCLLPGRCVLQQRVPCAQTGHTSPHKHTWFCCPHCLLCVRQEEKALKALKEKAKGGSIGGAGLKKSGKK